MIDFELFGGFGFRQTDGQTDKRTLVVVESLSRLKTDLVVTFNSFWLIRFRARIRINDGKNCNRQMLMKTMISRPLQCNCVGCLYVLLPKHGHQFSAFYPGYCWIQIIYFSLATQLNFKCTNAFEYFVDIAPRLTATWWFLRLKCESSTRGIFRTTHRNVHNTDQRLQVILNYYISL